MTLQEIKARLRAGAYAWPGGYPLFFLTSDGETLSFATVREQWREVVAAHLSGETASGWHVAACDVNWEDSAMLCAHSGAAIESAYGGA